MKYLRVMLIVFFLFLVCQTIGQTYPPIEKIPAKSISYDYNFSVKDFLHQVHSPLSGMEVRGILVADYIKKACLRYNISQKLILARIEFEQNGLTAKVKRGGGKPYWMYPNGTYAPLSSVLDRLTGYGQIWADREPDHRSCKKYLGFFRQVRGCCRCYRRDWKKFHDFNEVLYNYAPKGKAVIDYNSIVKRYWPEMFEQ